MQLKKMGITHKIDINLKSELWNEIHRMYEEMGDEIAMQYGGSKAHHSSNGNKKKSMF